MSHIELNKAFLLFWNIFSEIEKKIVILGQKSVFLIKLWHIQLH